MKRKISDAHSIQYIYPMVLFLRDRNAKNFFRLHVYRFFYSAKNFSNCILGNISKFVLVEALKIRRPEASKALRAIR